MLSPWWYRGTKEKNRSLSFKENIIVRKEEVKIMKQDLCHIFLINICDVHDVQIKKMMHLLLSSFRKIFVCYEKNKLRK